MKDVIDDIILEIKNSETDRAYFDTMTFSEKQLQDLSSALKTNNSLQYLNLCNCDLDASDLGILKEGIIQNKTLNTLMIEEFKGNEDYREIIEHVQANKAKCASGLKK